ncbi:MAG: sulfatase-like hydrolase/transferase [Gammaproteobacteria bacterium]|nr:sulfatase-like hydrolase/transferase [Gammaproteobacteria bacterium]
MPIALYTHRQQLIKRYFLLAYFIAVVICSRYFEGALALVDLRTTFFNAAILLTYPVIYLLPAYLLTRFALWSARLLPSKRALHPLVATVAVISTAAINMALLADSKLYELYGFHINGFVINLVSTPGGIESLGGDMQTKISFALVAFAAFAFHALLLWAVVHLSSNSGLAANKRRLRWLLVIFIVVAISERIVFGVSDIQLHGPVLESAERLPIYGNVTFRSAAARLGFVVEQRKKGFRIGQKNLELNYPQAPLQVNAPDKPLNIIFLLAESLRWDMLTPEIMPATYQLAEHALKLENHYSGGNGTRQGLFSFFYGLYGSYWDAFLHSERGPVLIDVLQQQNYQINAYTSAAFTYPEFDRTLFSQLPADALHQFDGSVSVVDRDQRNTSAIIKSIRDRDPQRPFMMFMFYESTHARYFFPEALAIRKPFLGNLNYATMSRKSLRKDIDQLKNRYVNASHYVDTQIARVITALKQENLMDNTILIVSGDHGEEFMEKGHWGHNAGFSEEQVRTPMVIWLPGTEANVVTSITSHLDIVPTLMPLLGVSNPRADYSLGIDLLGDGSRRYTVVSDWAGVAYVGPEYKFNIPFRSEFSTRSVLRTKDDREVEDQLDFFSRFNDDLKAMIENAKKFSKKSQ